MREVRRLAREAGVPVRAGTLCRSNLARRGLPEMLQAAVERANHPANRSLACWLDQGVRDDESLYVHLYRPESGEPLDASATAEALPVPFCKPIKNEWSCPEAW